MDRASPRSMITRGALVLVLFVALGYLAIRLVPGAGTRLKSADPAWLAACVVLELVAVTGFAACFAACFSYPPYLVRFSRCAQIALGELAAFAVVPTGVAAPLLRFWALHRGGMPYGTIGVRSVVHAPLLNVPYVVAAVLLGAGAATGAGPGDASLGAALAPIGVVLFAVLVAVLFTRLGRSKRLESSDGWRAILREVARIVPDGLREIPRRARHPGAIGGATIWWAGDCAVLWAGFHAVGASPNVGVVALAYMLGQLGTTLPLPGGVGGVEPIMLGVMTASGIGVGVGAAAIIVYRAVALGIQSAAGAVAIGLLIPAVRAEARR
jgi:uncharacterized membrane protein YbhN (UPF0104 family)